MLLGKRPRGPMKRTTSLKEFSFDLNDAVETPPLSDSHNPPPPPTAIGAGGQLMAGSDQRSLASLVSPRLPRRHSADLFETAHFLRCCSLCKRHLVSGRDIYMYRGDSAFCSLECRQLQINQDEKKEKFARLSSKKDVKSSATSAQVSATGGKIAAV